MDFHLDYIQATVTTPSHSVLGTIARQASHLGLVGKAELPGLHGYENRVEFVTEDGGRHLAVMFGGYNPGTNIRGSGHLSDKIAQLIRTCSPEFKISRVDVAVDLSREGLYSDIKAKVLPFCALHGIQVTMWTDPNNPEMGETIYIGGKNSPVRWRIYQKGYEQLAKGHASADDFDPHWVRIEAQIRPEKRDKARFTTMKPHEMLGYALWSRRLLAELFDFHVDQVKRERRSPNDFWEKVQYGLSGQAYGGVFVRGGAFLELLDGNPAPTNRQAIEAFCNHAYAHLLAAVDPDAPAEMGFEVLDAATYWAEVMASSQAAVEAERAKESARAEV